MMQQRHGHFLLLVTVIASASVLCAKVTSAVQFIPINSDTIAWDISGDGTTVVGGAGGGGFHWTMNNGFQLLSDLGTAHAVSFDGSKIAGTDRNGLPAVRT